MEFHPFAQPLAAWIRSLLAPDAADPDAEILALWYILNDMPAWKPAVLVRAPTRRGGSRACSPCNLSSWTRPMSDVPIQDPMPDEGVGNVLFASPALSRRVIHSLQRGEHT